MAMLNNQMVCPQQVGEFNMKLFHCQYLLVMIITLVDFPFQSGAPSRAKAFRNASKKWLNELWFMVDITN